MAGKLGDAPVLPAAPLMSRSRLGSVAMSLSAGDVAAADPSASGSLLPPGVSPMKTASGSGHAHPLGSSNAPKKLLQCSKISIPPRAYEQFFKIKTRGVHTFLRDAEEVDQRLPQILPRGASYSTRFTTFAELIEKRALTQEAGDIVHLSLEDLQMLFLAKCLDHNLKPSWERQVRFLAVLSERCKGNFFSLRENGLSSNAAEAIAHVLSKDIHYSVVDLSGNRLRDAGARTIAKLVEVNRTMVHLGLRSNDIGHEGGAAIAMALQKNNTVVSIDFGAHSGVNGNHLGTKGAEAFGAMLRTNQVLSMLNLSSNGLGSDGVASIVNGLLNNRVLRRLNISYNNAGLSGTRALAQALHSCSITHLDLQHNALGDAGGHCLFSALLESVENVCEHIQVLRLEYNGLGEQTARDVARFLQTSTVIQELRLCGNSFKTCADVIANGLKESRQVEALYMSACDITSVGAIAFSAALAVNTSLRTLDLSQNRMKNDGVIAIAGAMRRNQTIRQLSLACNSFTDPGGAAVASIIRENVGLRSLNLRQNGMTAVSGEALDEQLQRNKTLEKLDVLYNDFTYKSLVGIGKSLARNIEANKKLIGPRLLNDVEVLGTKEMELVHVREEIELERKATKDRSERLLRRTEEVHVALEKYRRDVHELEIALSSVRSVCTDAENVARHLEEKVNYEISLLRGRKTGYDIKAQQERDKRDKIVRDTERLKRILKQQQDSMEERLLPLRAELEAKQAEVNLDISDCNFIAEKLVELEAKKKQLEARLGIKLQKATPAAKRKLTAK